MIKPDYFELIFRNWVKRVCLEVKGVVCVSIVVKGTTNGTASDFDGNFTLDVPDNSNIRKSSIAL